MMVTDPCQHLEMEMACDANKIRSDLFIRPRYWLVASLVLTDLVCRNCWGGEGGNKRLHRWESRGDSAKLCIGRCPQNLLATCRKMQDTYML